MTTISAIIMAENQDSLDPQNFLAKQDPQILTNILLNEILDALNQLSEKLDILPLTAKREKRSPFNFNDYLGFDYGGNHCVKTC